MPLCTPAWHHRPSSVRLWSSASSPPAPVGGCTEAQWGKKCVCELRPLFQTHTGECGIFGDVKGHLGKCGDEVGVCTGTEIIRWGHILAGGMGRG